jgi:hypothetical protein
MMFLGLVLFFLPVIFLLYLATRNVDEPFDPNGHL